MYDPRMFLGMIAGILFTLALVMGVWKSHRRAKVKGRIFTLLAVLGLLAFHAVVPPHYNAITELAATVGGLGVVVALVLQFIAEVTR